MAELIVWIRLIPSMLRDFIRCYVARAIATRVVGPEGLLDRMDGYHSTATRADARVVIEVHDDSIIQLLREGCFVETELVTFRLSVKKEFGIVPCAHQVVVTVTPTEKLNAAVADLTFKVDGDDRDGAPKPMHLQDLSSGSVNHYFTPGGKARLFGERLKFDKNDPAQGPFMVNGSHIEKLDVNAVEQKGLGQYELLLSGNYAPGVYTLQIRSIPEGETELLVGKLNFELEIHNGQQPAA